MTIPKKKPSSRWKPVQTTLQRWHGAVAGVLRLT